MRFVFNLSFGEKKMKEKSTKSKREQQEPKKCVDNTQRKKK